MALVIPTNVASLQAQVHLSHNQKALQGSFQKLSSGFRIVTAADDAAGLAISESMKSQIRSYTVAERNAADAISMAQTAEGALGEITNVLGRMRELSMQGANGSITSTDRGFLNEEFTALKSEIVRIQGNTKFNEHLLLNSVGTAITFQVGLNNTAADQLSVTFGGLNLGTLTSVGTVLSGTGASASLGMLAIVDKALTTVSTQRSKFGAAMNRLDVATSNIQTMRTNIAAANSRIRDVDVADESAVMARNQVLSQAGVAVLSQANQLPSMAMSLLGR